MSLEDYRLINVLLAGLTAMFLWVRFNDRPSSVPRSGRFLRHGIVAAFGMGSLASLELYAKSAPFTLASVAMTLIYLTILGSLWASSRH